jgi:hypothetical protein
MSWPVWFALGFTVGVGAAARRNSDRRRYRTAHRRLQEQACQELAARIALYNHANGNGKIHVVPRKPNL